MGLVWFLEQPQPETVLQLQPRNCRPAGEIIHWLLVQYSTVVPNRSTINVVVFCLM